MHILRFSCRITHLGVSGLPTERPNYGQFFICPILTPSVRHILRKTLKYALSITSILTMGVAEEVR